MKCRHKKIGWPRRIVGLDFATCLNCGQKVEIEIFQEDFHEKVSDSRWFVRFFEWLCSC